MSVSCCFQRFAGRTFEASIVLWIAATLTAAGQTATQVTIQAKSADQFVGSMGVNVHMESTMKPYYEKKYLRINDRLQLLGMRHIRDEMNQADPCFNNRTFIEEIQKIGRLGYTLTGVIEGGNDYPGTCPEQLPEVLEADHVLPMILNLWPTIDSVEGPNEPDNPQPKFDYGKGRPRFRHYPLGAIHESQDLWQIVKHGTIPDCDEIKDCEKIKELPVLAMSEGNANHFTLLENDVKSGKIQPPGQYTSAGNMHAYQGGSRGDGMGGSSLASYIRLSRKWTGHEPLWTTEMGYHNNTHYLADGEQQGVSERAAAIYLPAAFLSGFNQGVVRSYSYELIDETKEAPLACLMTNNPGNPQCGGYGYYGLLHFDLTPKPAFTALMNLIQILKEPESNLEPGSLAIGFSADPGAKPYSPEYTLLEKSNGDYYLAIWNDISVYEIATCKAWNQKNLCTRPVPGRDIPAEKVEVTISFSLPESFTVYAPNDASGANPTSAYTLSATTDSITIDLPPEVLIIRISSSGA